MPRLQNRRLTMRFLPLAVAIFPLLGSGYAHSTDVWLAANRKSCDEVCGATDRPKPSPTGNYKADAKHKFYICASNAAGEGWRTGFNLKPHWQNHCYVTWVLSRRL